MLSKRSIRGEFAVQLVFASIALIVTFSLILYGYIKSEIDSDIKDELLNQAKFIATSKSDYNVGSKIDVYILESVKASEVSINILKLKISKEDRNQINFKKFEEKDRNYLQIFYPYNLKESLFINITKDITNTHNLLHKIFNSILILNFIALILIVIYAFILSKTMLKPITTLTHKLIKRDENHLKEMNIDNLPIEFLPLGESINKLINKIKLYIMYKKELFIGTAHELKTPLAVMKLKNEVTLLKDRTTDEYKEVLKLNISSINEMNKMVGYILEMGRAEGAQFEEPVKIDVIEFLNKKVKDFKLLANRDGKSITLNSKVDSFLTTLQPTLLNHIVYNLIQNAINFSPKDKDIEIKAQLVDNELYIEVIDEGIGIDETLDLFAPFIRKGEKAGIGLGLFLAKTSSEALNAKISIRNREDKSGAIAFLKLHSTTR